MDLHPDRTTASSFDFLPSEKKISTYINFGSAEVSEVRNHGAHHPALTYHNASIENISIEDVTKSLSYVVNFTSLESIFQPIGYLRKLQ